MKNLKKSLNTVGQIYAIIEDETGEIVSGRHRAMAGALGRRTVNLQEIAQSLGVNREAAKIIVRMHSNVQRKVSEEETKLELLALAEALGNQGIPKEKIPEELIKWAPYSERYIRELLPDEYKHKEKKHKSIEDLQRLTEEDKVWLASTIDSTGSLYQDKYRQLWIKIFSTDRELVEKAARILGGGVTVGKSNKRKPLYVTSRHGTKSVKAILKLIQPYLKVKKDIAQKFVSDTAEAS